MTFSMPVWVCPTCRYAVSHNEYKRILCDPRCAKCQSHRWSEFVYISAGKDIRTILRQKGGSHEEEIRQEEVLGEP